MVAGRTALDVAKDALVLAEEGLKRRGKLNWLGEDETIHLSPLMRVVEEERSLAETLLDRYERNWDRRIEPVFEEMAY